MLVGLMDWMFGWGTVVQSFGTVSVTDSQLNSASLSDSLLNAVPITDSLFATVTVQDQPV